MVATCSKCSTQNKVRSYSSINVALNPELKAKVLSGELFLWECPCCSQQNLITFDCLYHDPSQKIMLWLLPGGTGEDGDRNNILAETEAGAYNSAIRSLPDYRFRIVDSAGDLIEKVMIFDAGLDDRCIEMVKFVARGELKDVDNLHFYRLQDDVMVFSGIKAGKMQGFGFGLNVYEDCEGILKRNPAVGAEEGFQHIDQEWIDSIMA